MCDLCKAFERSKEYYLVERVKSFLGSIQDNYIRVIYYDKKFFLNAKGQGITKEIFYCPLCGNKLSLIERK